MGFLHEPLLWFRGNTHDQAINLCRRRARGLGTARHRLREEGSSPLFPRPYRDFNAPVTGCFPSVEHVDARVSGLGSSLPRTPINDRPQLAKKWR